MVQALLVYGGSIMVSAVFIGYGLGPPKHIIDRDRVVELLLDHLPPLLDSINLKYNLFQQDNVLCHQAQVGQ